MSTRETFFATIKQAVAAQPVTEPKLPEHDESIIRLTRKDADLAAKLAEMINAAGMEAVLLNSHHDLPAAVKAICVKHGVKVALADADPAIDLLVHAATSCGVGVRRWSAEQNVAASFEVDAGLTGVAYAVAETGSLVMMASPMTGRLTSLAPMVHIALIRRNQIVADLLDLFDPSCLGKSPASDKRTMPSGCVLITGPSKTADIELKLVTGVHGPGFVYAIIMP